MKSDVIIKGNKLGFQIVLNPTLPFEQLLKEVEDKFRQADRFFDENRAYAISFEGRDLTPGEQNLIVDAISSCSRLRVGYIIDGARAVEKEFARAIEDLEDRNKEPDNPVIRADGVKELEPLPEEADRDEPEKKAEEWAEHFPESFPESRVGMNGQFYRGTLRSGQKIEVPGSLVILGDINPGAQIIAGGNVVVLGCLKGIVYAGYPDDESAFVTSMLMKPMQIQIGPFIARAPDGKEERKRLRRRKKAESFSPKIAFIENNNIIIDSISKELISEMSNSELKGEKHE